MTELETAKTVLCQNVRGVCNKYDEFFKKKPNHSTFNLFNRPSFIQTDLVTY
jgi:hypothetical protein